MPRFCGVVGCSNRADRDNKSFFRLPSIRKIGNTELSYKRRLKWLFALRRNDMTELKEKYLWICEEHFVSGKPAHLLDVNNPDWIPSKKMGYDSTNSKSHDAFINRYKRAHNRRKISAKEISDGTQTQLPHLKIIANSSLELPVLAESVENELKTVPANPKVTEVKSCCVKNCNSHHEIGTDIVFHKFPVKNEDLTRKWVKSICHNNFIPTIYHNVCSKHFTPDSYLNGYASVNQLKNDAIPTVFDFSVDINNQRKPVKNPSEVSNDSASIEEFDEECFEVKSVCDISSLNVNNTMSVAVQTENNICDWRGENMLQIFKDKTDSESSTHSEEILFSENGYGDSEEVLKQRLKNLTARYKKSQTRLKEYRKLCKLYVKEVTALREVISNLKQINSFTGDNYYEGKY